MATSLERFSAKVDRSAGPDGCWPWTGALDRDGYGRFWIGGGRTIQAHHFVHPHEPEMVVDHTCHNDTDCAGGACEHRRCCNPAHLESVTTGDNVRRGRTGENNGRKTHCPRNHPYNETNTRIYRGMRYCRACKRERKPQWLLH